MPTIPDNHAIVIEFQFTTAETKPRELYEIVLVEKAAANKDGSHVYKDIDATAIYLPASKESIIENGKATYFSFDSIPAPFINAATYLLS